MNTYYDWHSIRALLLVLVLGLYVVYAILAGAWQSRQARRDAVRLAKKGESFRAAPAGAVNDEARAIRPRREPAATGRASVTFRQAA
jgi:hypothetical protein